MSEITQDLTALSGLWTVVETWVTVPPSPPATQLCLRNPLRWGLLMSLPSNQISAISISTNPNLDSNTGFQLPTARPLVFSYRLHPALAQAAWWGWNGGGVTETVAVLEEIAIQ